MPRCYMVKKGISKTDIHEINEHNQWDQRQDDENPDSPTEGAVAPLCYTPLTNRPAQSDEHESTTPLSSRVLRSSLRAKSSLEYAVSSETPSSDKTHSQARSAEETEAAHDLLSLSQSLPPLMAPSMVVIHHSVPTEDDPPSPHHCYRPLSNELALEYASAEQNSNSARLRELKSKIEKQISRLKQVKVSDKCHESVSSNATLDSYTQNADQSTKCQGQEYACLNGVKQDIEITASVVRQERDPVIVENTSINYALVQAPPTDIVYLVQVEGGKDGELVVNGMPTPPGSDMQISVQGTTTGIARMAVQQPVETITIDETADLIVLPLSPEADVPHLIGAPSQIVRNDIEILSIEPQRKHTVWRPMAEQVKRTSSKAEPFREIIKSAEQVDSVDQRNLENSKNSTVFLINLPDRRRKHRGRKEKDKVMTIDAINQYKKTNENFRLGSSRNSKTKFFKVIEEDITDEQEPIESDTKTKFSCSECGKCYATSSNLSRHKQTHRSLDSQSAKKCTSCGKAYVSMSALAMHELTHDRIHRCDICGKKFSRQWLLQGHVRSHTGEKPFGCAHCGKAFADRSNLRAHMQTHSNEKRFECPNCSKSFALKSYLNKHLESTCVNYTNMNLKNRELKIKEHPKKNAETQTILSEEATFSIIVD